MKFMKKFIFTISLIVSTLVLINPALAVKRADFPNSSQLQPVPVDTFPNISHNINSITNPAQLPENNDQAPENIDLSSLVDEINVENENNSNVNYWPLLIFGTIFLVSIAFWFWPRRDNQSK